MEAPLSTHQEISLSRRAVLSYLLKLNKAIDARHSDLVQAITERFNNVLVDYVSYGHFKFLTCCTPEPHQLAAIECNTQQALRFSEKYEHVNSPPLDMLKADLERLALALETRFELEDEVVAGIAA